MVLFMVAGQQMAELQEAQSVLFGLAVLAEPHRSHQPTSALNL
jgi:hypothetical protein